METDLRETLVFSRFPEQSKEITMRGDSDRKVYSFPSYEMKCLKGGRCGSSGWLGEGGAGAVRPLWAPLHLNPGLV